MEIILGILIPLIGTTLGAGCVFFMKDSLKPNIKKILLGFAAGVMIAASIWSLLIPAIEMSSSWGKFSFVPATIGFLLGIGFLLLLDSIVPHLHANSTKEEGVKSNFKKSTKLMFAVALHNLPEGMAVGVVLAGAYAGNSLITMSGALILAMGIAIQNFPEGAIISMPLHSGGMSKKKSFLMGFLSGIVEPLGALLTFFLTRFISPILPYLLAFAAGAMLYVVIEELIPESQSGEHSNAATISAAIGFALMMILDVSLG